MPLKLCASFCKKVPAEVEFSSKSYLASVEVELPTNLSGDELNAEIHKTYAQLERAVDEQIGGQAATGASQPQQRSQGSSGAPTGAASTKQISYLLDLGKAREKPLSVLNSEALKRFGVESIYQLNRKDCSRYIEEMKAA
jgi:hypothetical protein